MADEVVEPRIVTAVGIAVSTDSRGRDTAKRVEAAMAAEVLKCNEEGISTSEENSAVIRERMMAARRRELDAIAAESQQ